MRRQLTLVGLAVALAVAGCEKVVFIAHIVTADEAEFDPRLVGEWREVIEPGDQDTEEGEDEECLTLDIERGHGNSYTIQFGNPCEADSASEVDDHMDQIGSLTAQLGRLGGRTVLDVHATRFDMTYPFSDVTDWFIPVHMLLAVEVDDGHELRVMLLDPRPVRSHLETGELPLAYLIDRWDSGYTLIIHERTEELRAALDAYLRRPNVWDDPYIFHRVPTDEGEAEAGHEG